MNWYIGQEIICIESNPEGDIRVGKTYYIKDIKLSACNCKKTMIDVGIKVQFGLVCNICCFLFKGNIHWFWDHRFVPLDSLMSKEIKELLTDLPQHLQNIENEKIYLETKKNYKENGIYEDCENDD